jgi:GcrA cell cycle regulator
MWTEQNTLRLCQLWSQGYSAAEIAREVGAASRSAVLGRVHRLGLSQRDPVRAQAVAERQKHNKEHRSSPSVQPTKPPTLYGDMAPDQCRWFCEPFEVPFMERFVCGEDAIAGSSYCTAHHRRVWEKPPQNPRADWLREQRERTRELLAALRQHAA